MVRCVIHHVTERQEQIKSMLAALGITLQRSMVGAMERSRTHSKPCQRNRARRAPGPLRVPDILRRTEW